MKKYLNQLAACVLLISTTACQQQQETTGTDTPPTFEHNLAGKTPWISGTVDAAEDKFTFAVISDLNGGERAGVFDVAVAQLNLLRPEFIVSVGDLIDGGTTDRVTFTREFDSFDARAAKLHAPLVRIGGNHDLSHPKMREFWAERYGPRYSHFIYKDVLFLFLDSEDYAEDRMVEIFTARDNAIKLLDAGETEKAQAGPYYQMQERVSGHIGTDQAAYFSKVIKDNPGVRWTFLFMHKPVWMNEDRDAYKEIALALDGRPYTLLNGHFHELQHHERGGRDHIILGTTGGSQNANSTSSFDHLTLVTVDTKEPAIAHIRLDGIMGKTGQIPAGGAALCFEAAKCKKPEATP